MQTPYDAQAVMDLLAPAIRALPRGGQTRLAEAVGVKPQTVNKWVKKQTAPYPEKWEQIEAFFDWEDGRIAKAAGVVLIPGPGHNEMTVVPPGASSANLVDLTEGVRALFEMFEQAFPDVDERRTAFTQLVEDVAVAMEREGSGSGDLVTIHFGPEGVRGGVLPGPPAKLRAAQGAGGVTKPRKAARKRRPSPEPEAEPE